MNVSIRHLYRRSNKYYDHETLIYYNYTLWLILNRSQSTFAQGAKIAADIKSYIKAEEVDDIIIVVPVKGSAGKTTKYRSASTKSKTSIGGQEMTTCANHQK